VRMWNVFRVNPSTYRLFYCAATTAAVQVLVCFVSHDHVLVCLMAHLMAFEHYWCQLCGTIRIITL
jgi:hypothetical protein